MRRPKGPVAQVLIPSVLMVVWVVVAQMWLANDSLGSSLTLGLLCAGFYAAIMSVGLYRKSPHNTDTRPSDEPTPTD